VKLITNLVTPATYLINANLNNKFNICAKLSCTCGGGGGRAEQRWDYTLKRVVYLYSDFPHLIQVCIFACTNLRLAYVSSSRSISIFTNFTKF
jgi:hypothetical protein